MSHVARAAWPGKGGFSGGAANCVLNNEQALKNGFKFLKALIQRWEDI